MPKPLIEKAPRDYVDSVAVQARSTRGPAVAAGVTTAGDIHEWLLGPALDIDSVIDLFEGFCWRLVAAGLPVHRAALNSGTLHPQLVGSSWIWEEQDGICDELRITFEALDDDAYLRSPLYRAIEFGEVIHLNARDPEQVARYPLLQDLHDRGLADYWVMPLAGVEGFRQDKMTISLSSKDEDGLAGAVFETIKQMLRLLSLHVARLMADRVALNIATAYLGEAAGRQVLEGSIQRGSGAPIEAVILVADLRRFTDLSTRLPPEAMLALLNAYFESLVTAIDDAGGEVLKFIGDGLLAAFPIGSGQASRKTMAERAYAAALAGLEGIDAINTHPPEALAAAEDWRPIRAGMALHIGTVFFGNIGAPERLDFTVIGQAVNAVARVEALTKDLARPLLITAPVAQDLDQPLDHLGQFDLRGVAEPLDLYAPPGLVWD